MKRKVIAAAAILLMLCLLSGCGKNGAYVFHCVDESGKGIEGVRLQVCTDDSCVLFTSDSSGDVVCTDMPAAEYEVHILLCPEGYSYDRDAVYTTARTFETHIFTLTAVK